MQTILLVEDNEMNRDLISRRLKRRGYEVVLAMDGAAGVESATKWIPDLILMDIGLPVLDGYQATRLIKEDPKTSRIPVIGLSAHAMSGDAERAIEAGCDDYDTKPIDWPRLLAKIQKLLELAAQEASEQSSPALGTRPSDAISTGGHLLVVDDTPLHLEMLSGRLSSLGYSFTLAKSPAEALEAIAGQTYDLVLVDVGLEHEGRPFWQALGEHPKAADLGCLVLSPIDMASEAVASLSEGADEMICQPFRMEELKKRVESTIYRRDVDRKLDRLRQNLETERRRTEYLMRSWLPEPMIEELRSTHRLPPRAYEEVAVLSWDVSSLAAPAQGADPIAALSVMQQLLVAFENFSEPHQIQLISVDGNRVLAAAGDFTRQTDPAMAVASCALQICRHATELESRPGLRVGIHLGPAVIGVLGRRGCRLGIWGEQAQVAERIRESSSSSGVRISSEAWAKLSGRIRGRALDALPGGTEPIYALDV